jgi:VIT1/CCC1 family predicted Fe2+/Mn2+ transporter
MISSTVPAGRPAAALLRRLGLLGAPSTSRHRNVQGGAARAAVLGAGDGLITNVSLVLGVAGAGSSHGSVVRLVGVAGLLAGAFSMAAGELVSVRAQAELVQRELDVERDELASEPHEEQMELAAMYRARGVPEDDARTVARILSATPHLALDTHARLELGVDPTRPLVRDHRRGGRGVLRRLGGRERPAAGWRYRGLDRSGRPPHGIAPAGGGGGGRGDHLWRG